jgi:protein TonB
MNIALPPEPAPAAPPPLLVARHKPPPEAEAAPETLIPVEELPVPGESEAPPLLEEMSARSGTPSLALAEAAGRLRAACQEAALQAYAALRRAQIDRHKQYPGEARQRRQEAGVRIRFTLKQDGSLQGEPELEGASQYRRLNHAALEAVRRSAPFPAFPPELAAESLPFSILIRFSTR